MFKKCCAKYLKKALIWVLHIIVCYLSVYGHTVQLEAEWVKLFCIEKIIFMSSGKCIWLKFLTSLLEFHLGLFLGTTSQYLFSADTICIMHPGTQPIHTKTGPIAAPWCWVRTQAWHILIPLQGCHYAFIQTNVDKALSCYMASPRSNKLNTHPHPDKIFPTAISPGALGFNLEKKCRKLKFSGKLLRCPLNTLVKSPRKSQRRKFFYSRWPPLPLIP